MIAVFSNHQMSLVNKPIVIPTNNYSNVIIPPAKIGCTSNLPKTMYAIIHKNDMTKMCHG